MILSILIQFNSILNRYPFVACEIFESEIAPILNAFFISNNSPTQYDYKYNPEIIFADLTSPEENKDISSHQQENASSPTNSKYMNTSGKKGNNGSSSSLNLLEFLFSFIDTNELLNPVLSGYFNKLVQVLFKKNPSKLIEYIYDKNGLLLIQLSKHVVQRSIAELTSLLIGYDNMLYDEKNYAHTQVKLQVIDNLLFTISHTHDIEVSLYFSIMNKYLCFEANFTVCFKLFRLE